MLDQFGLEVGPGFVGSRGNTVQSLSLANGGDGSGGWTDPGVQAQYAQTQQDVAALREWMAASGQPHVVTGTGSMADPNAGDSVAYLPSMMEAYGVKPTTGILNSYQNLVGSPYESGQVITGYNPNSDKYSVGAGEAGISGSDLMTRYMGQPSMSGQPAQQPAQQATPQAPQQPQTPQLGGLGQVAAGTQIPVSQSVSTPPTVQTDNAQPDDVIRSWFTANPGWNTDMLKGFMSSYGLTPEQVARATGRNPTDFIKEVNAAGRLPAQAGAQTQYVDYTQPLSPIAQGAGSGNLPYYYNTPAGSLASYYNPTYLRGNISAYGGMMGKDLNLRQSVPAAPPPVQSVTYVPPPSPSPAPTTVPGLAPAAPVATQSDFDTWYADYMRRQNLLDRGFGTGSGSDGIGGGSEGSDGSSDGPSGEA